MSSTGSTAGIMKLEDDPDVNRYDRKSYKYDLLLPLLSVAYNKDDGLFLGGGFSFIKNKWRKEPFASKHTLLANTALETNSFNFSYDGTFTDTFGKWDLNPSVTWQQPFFVNNYFGLGNETRFVKGLSVSPDDDQIDYYRMRINRFEFDMNLVKQLGGSGNFFIGPGYKSVQVEQTANRLLTDQGATDNFLRHEYSRIGTGIVVDTRDSPAFPKHGTKASVTYESLIALNSFSKSFSKLQADWAFYQSIDGRSKLVLASRVGFAHNTSDSEFFNSNTLGGRSNLRGYRRTRFYGTTSFYHNVDLRLKLFSFRSYIFPGSVGISAFHDTGRVWLTGEKSTTWHSGNGASLWLSPLNQLVLDFSYAKGEEKMLVFGMGFFF